MAILRKNLMNHLIEKYEKLSCPECGAHPEFKLDGNSIDHIGCCCHDEFNDKVKRDFCDEFLTLEMQLPDSSWVKITKKA